MMHFDGGTEVKKRAIPITIGVSALALALLVASLRAPGIQVVSVDPEHVVLEAGGPCAYSVWLNHASACDGCRYYDGVMIISATRVSRIVAYWDALDIGAPDSGDCFCGYWTCRNETGWHGGELWDAVAWRVWLPMVMRR